MMPFPGYTPALVMSNPSIHSFHGPKGGKDPWGVEYITNEETGNAAMPKTWDYILEDINDWEKVIKNPDLSTDLNVRPLPYRLHAGGIYKRTEENGGQ